MKKTPFVILVLFLFMPAYATIDEINLNWFNGFGDELLIRYLNEALECNKDVKIAQKNILKYRQDKNLKLSDEFPYASVGSDYLLLKVPKLAIPNNDLQTNSFALPFLTYWEIDWLLKKHDEVKKAKIDIENSLLDLKSAKLIVITDLASAYFNASCTNKQIELQKRIVFLQEEILARYEKMLKNGVISTSEINDAKENLLNEKNNLENLQKQKEEFLTQIAYLTGNSPYNINKIEITPFDKINYTGKYPQSLKGEIILNRPDILKLENDIKKKKIDITIAKKDFLPKINIFGVMVFSTIVQNFNWQGVLASLMAGANQTLFDGGKRIFTLKKQKIIYETSVENYLKGDINALKEVNDTLYALKKDCSVHKNNEKILSCANANLKNIQKSYQNGVKSYLEYMIENTDFIKKEKITANSKNNIFNNLISIYKAVGGAL